MSSNPFSRTLTLIVIALFLAGCATAPLDFPRQDSEAIVDTGDTSATFDRFWNHKLAVPMEAFARDKKQPDLVKVRAEMDEAVLEASNSIYGRALASPLMKDVFEGRTELFPADSSVITDDPEKLLNKISEDHQILVTALAGKIDEAESEVVVITPYFIPGKRGVEFWRYIAAMPAIVET